MKGVELMYDSIKHETEEAMLVEFEPGIEEWLPKSQCDEITIGSVETITVPVWLMEEKGLESYIYEY